MNRSLNRLLFIAVLGLAACNPTPPKTPQKEQAFFTETGEGSFYSNRLVGKKTAAGDTGSPSTTFTAAHQTLPLGTVVRVTNMENGLSVKVSIGDRGPFAKDRIIDLSSAAAQALGIHEDGVANVKLEAFKTDQGRAAG